MTTDTLPEITPLTPPAEPPSFISQPVEDWTDDEVIFFYDLYLATKAVSELSARELQITVRYGDIAKQRREQAEQTGFDAEVEAIRRQVSIQVERYAIAALLEEYHRRSFTEVARGNESEEVRLIVRFGNREIEMRATDMAVAFGGFGNPKTRDFTKALESVLALAKSAATQHRIRIERSKGRNWSFHTKDLRWSSAVIKMRLEDGETL
ncbi:MAG: hypothetical protein IPM36_01070 [Lewinellaceae bacterium]|nr:hypothetical protein [Lewinellaceae bacterium]